MAQNAADPEFQQRRAEQEEERQARVRLLREAELPIVEDLHGVGVEVSSVWDLVNTSTPYPDALPVLLRHLQVGGYPDRVMESLGRALAVKPAVFAWDTLRNLYLAAQGRGEEEGLAVALAASATANQFDQLVSLLSEESHGDTRIHFLKAIRRVGGEKGNAVLQSVNNHPLLGKEATALLKRRRQ